MNRSTVLALVIGFAQLNVARAETIPLGGSLDTRIRTASYDPDQVYRLRGYAGYEIDLQFESGETFTGLGAGDVEGLAFLGKENHLFLKPKALKVATNITVLTNRRQYQLDYSAVGRTPLPGDEVIYALKFQYPERRDAKLEAEQLEATLKAASNTRPHNIDYWYCGDPTLKPSGAVDDGVHTRLTFAANAELPAVFVRNEDGSESLLNFSMDQGDVVIHRVAHRLILRRGALRGCIVNQGFSSASPRLNSGTVAPEVMRRVQTGAP
jgi:type IV secretion system protein VirB9